MQSELDVVVLFKCNKNAGTVMKTGRMHEERWKIIALFFAGVNHVHKT